MSSDIAVEQSVRAIDKIGIMRICVNGEVQMVCAE